MSLGWHSNPNACVHIHKGIDPSSASLTTLSFCPDCLRLFETLFSFNVGLRAVSQRVTVINVTGSAPSFGALAFDPWHCRATPVLWKKSL